MRTAVATVMLLALVSACPAQTVSIKVADMPLRDVVQLLRQMTGAQIIGENVAPNDQLRITLQLEEVPLKQVIREICAQAGWHYTRFGRGYHVMPGVEEDRRPRVSVGDYEVVLEQAAIQWTHSLSFRKPDRGTHSTHQLTLRLVAEAVDDELMDAFYAFDPNVLAVTDTGVTLEPVLKQVWGPQGGQNDEVQAGISVAAPTEGATTLAQLEGDLVLYAKVDRAAFEFTPAEVGQTKTAGEIAVTLVALDTETGVVRTELRVPDPNPGPNANQLAPGQPSVRVGLFDVDGMAARWTSSGSNGGGQNGICTYKQTYSFQLDAGFRPAKFRYRVATLRDPTERLTYLFEDIPLPLEETAKPPVDQLP